MRHVGCRGGKGEGGGARAVAHRTRRAMMPLEAARYHQPPCSHAHTLTRRALSTRELRWVAAVAGKLAACV